MLAAAVLLEGCSKPCVADLARSIVEGEKCTTSDVCVVAEGTGIFTCGALVVDTKRSSIEEAMRECGEKRQDFDCSSMWSGMYACVDGECVDTASAALEGP